jgi:hypothetical protein
MDIRYCGCVMPKRRNGDTRVDSLFDDNNGADYGSLMGRNHADLVHTYRFRTYTGERREEEAVTKVRK